ncbi:isochorismatase hydrolase [Mycena capillaripes]|nr:isochorismatase hydrolase [Mycena capillaripes]
MAGKTALVFLDYQVGILARVEQTKLAQFLLRVSAAAGAARAANYPVIYVTVEFRPKHPEISALSFASTRVKASGGFVAGDASVAVHPDVAPQEGDIAVIKRRVSAFAGSDFDAVLRGLGVDTLAADLDFKLTVLEDLCFDMDEEVHRVLVEKVFPRQATVMSSEQWITEVSKE